MHIVCKFPTVNSNCLSDQIFPPSPNFEGLKEQLGSRGEGSRRWKSREKGTLTLLLISASQPKVDLNWGQKKVSNCLKFGVLIFCWTLFFDTQPKAICLIILPWNYEIFLRLLQKNKSREREKCVRNTEFLLTSYWVWLIQLTGYGY